MILFKTDKLSEFIEVVGAIFLFGPKRMISKNKIV